MTTTTKPKPSCRRGDVVLVLFPNSNLKTAKPRPTLVVQANDLRTELPQVVVCMITGKTFRAGHPSRVLVSPANPEGKRSGLLSESVVMTDNLATIAEAAIERVIGTLPMEMVNRALRHTLGL